MLGLVLLGAFLSVFATKTFPLAFDDGARISGLSLPGVGASASGEPVLTSAVLPGTVRRDQLGDGLLLAGGATGGEASVLARTGSSLPYELYVVRQGDTAGSVAAQFGIEVRYLMWANAELLDSDLLEVGYVLIVPAGNGIIHHVRYGETLSDIAARYNVSVDAIIGWSGNGIASPDQVIEDAILFVPGGEMPMAPLPEPTPLPTDAPVSPPVLVEAPPTAAPTSAPLQAASAPAPAVAPSGGGGGGLIWPVYGPISSYMDASHPLGIDIDLFSNPFAGIVASTSGTVTFAGGDPCCSYGLYIVIVSPSGIETLYAHLSSLGVSPGEYVSQGQYIGNAGCTGYCTGNHLHFEVIDNGVRVDPLAYLP